MLFSSSIFMSHNIWYCLSIIPAFTRSIMSKTNIIALCEIPVAFISGHLYVKSDVYGFGVVLLEMLSGQRAMDPNRPSGQHKLVDWAMPMLADRRKLARLMDPRLEGQYSSKGAFQAAQLTLSCLAGEPKSRPSMKDVVETLEHIEAINTRSKEGRNTSKQPVARSRGHTPVHGNSPLHTRSEHRGQGINGNHHTHRA
ncbi:hypothetical protein Cni_G27713 [Canna indica]|uniref:Serine-threonine/tyrosine-protein kinase catalytic domain-containing protein n=1 Tax=Canna indica TaxID=4628 RepID=A0AAQ3QRN6_9LILI|nr:hypothetical protein Cni_G27713 [Canna indica]